MAQEQKNVVAAGVETKPVVVTSGVQEVKFNGAGKTIAQVRDSLKKVLNLGPDTQIFVGTGKDKMLLTPEDAENMVLTGGETLEFKKAAGQKGF